MRTRQKPSTAATRVHVNDNIGKWEKNTCEEMSQLLIWWTVRPPGKRAVEVCARRPVACVRLGSSRGQYWNNNYATRDLVRANSCASRSAAICPSYSSPWFPASTSTVGPAPFAIEVICTNVLAQPAILVIFGDARYPICLPDPARSIVQETGELLI